MTRSLVLFPTALEAEKILGRDLESGILNPLAELPGSPVAAICGFGLPVATAMSAHLIGESKADHVLLLGIAGSYDLARAPLGSVVHGSAVSVAGIGAGQGQDHISAVDLGFDPHAALPLAKQTLALSILARNGTNGAIISVAAASANKIEAGRHRQSNSQALIEDMESYGVALAANLVGCPISIVRAVSNEVGNRDKQAWKIGDALAALRQALPNLLSAAQSPQE